MPMIEVPQPQLNTAFMMPSAAPTDSRFMTEAMAGISRLRNTAISSRKASTTTTAMNSGSLDDSTCAKSCWVAVAPPTSTVTPVPA